MNKTKYWIRFSFLLSLLTASGCTMVKPWQKGTLSKAEMGWKGDALEASFEQHVFSSKEASHGGDGAAGGGCGCN